MQKETWIVVANSTQARIFKLEGLTLIEQDSLIHAESRMHEKDLIADKPGAAYSGVAQGRYGMGQQQSPKKIEVSLFAKQISDHLDNARATGRLERIYLAASPSFLGLLRSEMNNHTQNLVAAEVDKDITHMKEDEILGYFPIGL